MQIKKMIFMTFIHKRDFPFSIGILIVILKSLVDSAHSYKKISKDYMQ